MGTGTFHKHVAHARNAKSLVSRSADSSCLSGGFYTSPASGSTINSLTPLNITWDTTCLTPVSDLVDIYLYLPSAAAPRLHLWENVNYKPGFYVADLMPRWWNSTASEQLQLLIIQAGDAPFLATLPAGPVFTATYAAPSTGVPASAQTSGVSASSDSVTNVQQSTASSSSRHLPGGKVAAAVIMPLLVVAALAAFFWIRRSRAKGREKRKEWTEKVDKRMSVVSSDWQSISVVGAQAAIRSSMAIRGSGSMDQARASYAEMAQRESMVANLAGMGVQAPGGGVGGFFIPGQEDPMVNPIMSMPTPSIPGLPRPTSVLSTTSPQGPPLRPGLGTGVGLRSSAYSNAAAAARVSRVSFAEPHIPGKASMEGRRSIYERERPSVDSRRSVYSQNTQNTRGSRAFHYANDDDEEEMPPLPEGAAERASQFYMLGSGVGLGAGTGSAGGLGGHMNISTSTLNSNNSNSSGAQEASRLSRFEEVYGEYGFAVEGPEYEAQEAYAYTSPEPSPAYPSSTYPVSPPFPSAFPASNASSTAFPTAFPSTYAQSPSPIVTDVARVEGTGAMSPTQRLGPVALSADDIKRRISMRSASRNGSNGSVGGSVSIGKTSFESGGFEDVGPALTMMRVQEQEQEQQNYHAHTASAAFAAGASETLFTASPSPYQTSFTSSEPSSLNSFNTTSATSLNAPSPITTVSTQEDGSVFSGMAPPKNGSSPDDMLRAYAERKAAAAAASSGASSPISPASPVSGGGIGGKLKTLKGKMSVPSPLGRRFSTEAREVRGERGERERGERERGERERGERERDGSESGHGHAM
ncbi:hypothetical protein BDP27DRAFT_1368648 [Rhodocollybia butyracea]|uniref:Uncharacterized protein n=1 Tax=Rhodocollybia butyracea TaxID=206335 RepID=A0A9P5U1R5_9AGAR|nr:hypothetical protein BDP27DRAFT_1368648 [Rhodocollybia butyracea]